MADSDTTGWIDGTIGVELQPMLVPKPIGYLVQVNRKTVASLTPEAVEKAYLRFQELAQARQRRMQKFRGLE